MKHTSPEYRDFHCDDYHLVQLINSAYVKPPRPWWHFGITVFIVGFVVLVALAWTVGR